MRIIGDGGHAKVVRDVHMSMREWHDDGYYFIAVGDNVSRSNEAFANSSRLYAKLIHKTAYVVADSMGQGTVVMAGAVVQPGTIIGKHCIINTCASVDHDCTLGDFVHVAPGARLCGNVTVGEGALIGAGAVCVPGAVIAPWSLVKAGSVAK